jgi:hypothetical protein
MDKYRAPLIPATPEAQIGRTVVQGQSGQKVSETSLSTNELRGVVVRNPSCAGGIGRRIVV